MDPDGSDQREFARGLRNAVGMRAIGRYVFATNQGSDHLGLQKPDETFYALKEGTDYGWPYCHSSNGKIFADPGFKRPGQCTSVPAPYAFFPSHSSALGFDYFNDPDAPAVIRDGFLVALHGSTNKAIGHGYQIVLMRKGDRNENFITGFLNKGVVNGRPCDIMKIDASSFLFSDDNKGVVYLVRLKGTEPKIAASADPMGTDQTTEITAPAGPQARSCLPAVIFIWAALLRSYL